MDALETVVRAEIKALQDAIENPPRFPDFRMRQHFIELCTHDLRSYKKLLEDAGISLD